MKFISSAILIAIFSFLQLVSQIRINEVCASNSESLFDEDADTPDWIELHNYSNVPINLKDYRISDRNDFEKGWQFPDTVIQPNEYLVVFASNKNRVSSNNYAMYIKSDNSIVSHNNRDGFRLKYKQIVGDFEAEVSIKSMNNEGRWGVAGLQVRETLSDTTNFMSILATSKEKGGFNIFYREKVLESPTWSPIYGGTNLPYTKLWMKRENDSIYVAYKDRADKLINTQVFPNFLNNLLYLGVTVSGGNTNDYSKFIINDFIIDNIKIDLSQLPAFEVNTLAEGYDIQYNELHTDFTIKDDETLYLFKNRELIQSVPLQTMTGDITNIYTSSNKLMITDKYTPGKENSVGYISRLPKPKINFSDNKLTIIDTTNAIVRYTTDNSFPNESSKIFNSNGIIQFDKTTTVKAIAFKKDYLPSFASTNILFVDEPETNLPIVSISADSNDLWGDYGIIADLIGITNANFNYFSDYNNLILDQNVEIKVHGQSTKLIPQKSLRVYANEKGEENRIKNLFFKKTNLKEYDQLVLRNSGQDWGATFLRDAYNSIIAKRLNNQIVPEYEPVLFFLNSEYYGLINLRERIEDDYIADYFSINGESITYVKNNGDVEKGDYSIYQDYYNTILKTDFTDASKLDEINKVIDINNFIDYSLLYVFSINTDWPNLNIKVFISDDLDGKVRYIINDLDVTYGYGFGKSDFGKLEQTLNDSINQFSIILQKFLQNKQFKTQFITRAADLVNSVFRPENMIHVLDSLADRIRPVIPIQQKRWPESCVNWEDKLDEWKFFLTERPEYFIKNFDYYLNNEIGTSLFTLSTYPTNSGTYKVNTITVDTSDWTGRYFQTLPVTITAVPKHGKKFIRWNHDSLGSKPTITTTLPESMFLVAIYEDVVISQEEKLIVVNEIMYNADKDSDTKDWIELYNTGTKAVNLKGWSLIDEDITHDLFVIEEDYLIQPDEYVILTKEKTEFENIINIDNKIFGDFVFGFGGNDIVVLKDSEGNTHDSVNYDNDVPWPINADGTGYTIELKNPRFDNNEAVNWEVSQNELGTPGLINSNYDTISSVILADNYKKNINIKQSDKIYKIETTTRIENIYLYDISGREIKSKYINYNSFKLDVSKYSSGVYLLLIDFGDKTNTIKLILN